MVGLGHKVPEFPLVRQHLQSSLSLGQAALKLLAEYHVVERLKTIVILLN
jgi:hypothetical protein